MAKVLIRPGKIQRIANYVLCEGPLCHLDLRGRGGRYASVLDVFVLPPSRVMHPLILFMFLFFADLNNPNTSKKRISPIK